MAVQSLYRRYRPRRFSEVKGQEHVVRSLRNAVINHREGQAYLFSGPRGTGKTTSARILAKVLNCEESVDGEPCCACASCLAVEAGTSYDVHELDAASNNGVDAMRDLIDKAMLGTPGRHKVYILDEVHMLSKAAEAALLKTLEEPPPHVVFVLATTDPQKVSDTIRSRTQHLQFHLLPMDVMESHIRWLAIDAGLDVTDGAVQAVLRRGGGSARDTISALELVAAGGGDAVDETPLDEFVESLIESDPGRALAAVAAVMRQGRDARTLAESLIAHLRDCFLSLMAPELVQLPDQRAAEVGELAQRLGPASTVRAMEGLGSMLVEMRHAPDPRVLLEVALVKLTSASADSGVSALMARIEKLEQLVARGGGSSGSAIPAGSSPAASFGSARGAATTGSGPAATGSAGSAGAQGSSGSVSGTGQGVGGGLGAARSSQDPAPRDPTTGRAVLGSRTRRDPSPSEMSPGEMSPGEMSPSGSGGSAADRTAATAERAATTSERPATTSTPAGSAESQIAQRADQPTSPVTDISERAGQRDSVNPSTSGAGTVAPVTQLRAAGSPGGDPLSSNQLTAAHSALIASMRPLAKAVLAAGSFVGERDGVVSLAVPSDPLKRRAEDQRVDIERGLTEHFGRPLRISVTVAAGSGRPEEDGPPSHSSTAPTRAEEDDIDISDLVDAPIVPIVSNIDRISAAFPGSELIEDRD